MRFHKLTSILGFFFAASVLQAAPPNVVVIISDDQRWDHYSFMGHEAIRTPRLDRLASEGLTFTRGYVPTSLCRPSLATIITGLYPHQHRVTGNDPRPPEGKDGHKLRREGDPAYLAQVEKLNQRLTVLPTLPRLLGEAGYVSFQTGKWWEGDSARAGFTDGMSHGDPKQGGRHGDEGLKIGRQTMQPVYDFIDSAVAEGKPFFLWYAPMMPHLPHDPPQRLLDKYTTDGRPKPVARYFAMCEWFDETCGQLLDHLDRKGLSADTLVVYVTDNGWTQTAEPPSAFGGPKGKQSPYDGGVRTPIILRRPGHIQPRRDGRSLASSIDLAPTILAACLGPEAAGGLAKKASLPGINLLDADAVSKRDAVFGEIYTHDVADLDRPAASLRFRWCIEGDWKLILPHAPNEPDARPELYDLSGDPREERDLAASHPQVADRLASRIERWWPLK